MMDSIIAVINLLIYKNLIEKGENYFEKFVYQLELKKFYKNHTQAKLINNH
jgi:hypothetical protein